MVSTKEIDAKYMLKPSNGLSVVKDFIGPVVAGSNHRPLFSFANFKQTNKKTNRYTNVVKCDSCGTTVEQNFR